MDLDRFGRLLVLHGATLDDWPEGERREAELLLAWSSEALRLRDEAMQMDAILRQAGSVVSPAAVERVIDRVMAQLDDNPTPYTGLSPDLVPDEGWLGLPPAIRTPWVPAALLAGMAVVGFLLGGVVQPPQSRQASDFVELLMNRSMAGFDL